MKNKINLGCGTKCQEDYLGVDQYDNDVVDVVVDLDNPPWDDLPSNHFKKIKSIHCIEHLENWKHVWKEIYRIAHPKAEILIRVPHFSFDGSRDHEGKHGVFFPDNFLSGSDREWIRDCKFKVKERHLRWRAKSNYEREGNSKAGLILNILGRVFNPIVSLMPAALAERFCYFFGGFEEIEWVLEVEK